MRSALLLMLLAMIFGACQPETTSVEEEPYFGPVKKVTAQSYRLTEENGSAVKKEITDSLPEWLPLIEYERVYSRSGLIEKELPGRPYSLEASDTIYYTYNENQRLATKSFRSPHPEENRLTNYMYNPDGQLNAVNVLLPDEQIDSVFLYNYDSEGTLRSINEFHNAEDYQDFVASRVRKFFHNVKNMVREDHYAKNPYTGKHYYAKKITKKFNKKGQLFEKVIESGGKTTYQYEYGPSGRLISILTLDGLKQPIEKTTMEYDEYGNIVLKSFQTDVGSYSYRCVYEYDDKDNWIERRIFIADEENPSYIVERTFEYWQ